MAEEATTVEQSGPFNGDSVMIDLESMALGPNAAIFQIAAVQFDSKGGLIRPDGFTCDVDLLSCLMAGGEVDSDTVRWWRDQGGPSIKLPKDIRSALVSLSAWFNGLKNVERIWAQGPAFDIAVLEGYYRRLGMETPWAFNRVRDTRTVYDLARQYGWEKDPALGPSHVALEDVINQIKQLNSALRFLNTYPGRRDGFVSEETRFKVDVPTGVVR